MSPAQILLLALGLTAAWFVIALAAAVVLCKSIDHADRTELGPEPTPVTGGRIR